MATKSKPAKVPATIPVLLPSAEPVKAVVPPVDPDETGSDDLEALLSELGGGIESYTVSVFRRQVQGAGAGRLGYVTRAPLAGFALDDLQREFGGGQYVLKFLDEGGKIRKSRTLVVEGAPSSALPSSHPGPTETETDRLLRAVLEKLATGGAQSPQPDMFTMFTKFAEVMKTLAPAPVAAGGGDAKALLDMYFKGKQDAMNDAPPADNGLRSVITDFGAPLLALAKENIEVQRQRVANEPQATPAPVVASNIPEGVPDVAPQWVYLMRSQVQGLYQRAIAKKNPRVYANSMVEDLPDMYVATVQDALVAPDFVDQFIAAYPMFGQTPELRAWLEEFVDEARDLLLTDGDAEEDDKREEAAANG